METQHPYDRDDAHTGFAKVYPRSNHPGARIVRDQDEFQRATDRANAILNPGTPVRERTAFDEIFDLIELIGARVASHGCELCDMAAKARATADALSGDQPETCAEGGIEPGPPPPPEALLGRVIYHLERLQRQVDRLPIEDVHAQVRRLHRMI